MEPYTLYRSGSITTVTETSMSTSLTSAGFRQLSCPPPPATRGDFVRPNEWAYTRVDSSVSNGSQQQFISGKWSSTSYGFLGDEAVAFADVSSYRNRAYNQALSRLSEKIRGSLDLSVAAVESKQTARMVNLVGRYTQAMTRMRSAYLKDFARLISSSKQSQRQKLWLAKKYGKEVEKLPYAKKYYRRVPVNRGLVNRASALGANGWLEWTYGWKPLISDIRGVADNLVGQVRGVSSYYSASGNIGVDLRRSSKANASYPPTVETASGVVGCRIKVRMLGGFDLDLSRWTSLNPASVIWEATPYSFVLDWFFDIGSYMRNLETAYSFSNRFQWGYVSYLSAVEYTFSVSGKTTGSQNYITRSSRAVKQVVSFTRSNSVSYPIPDVPKFNVDLGSSRLLSAASLLRQLIKK